MNAPAAMARAVSLATAGRRFLLGVAGPPGSGKSTFSVELVQHVNAALDTPAPAAAVLAMDGFHLPAVEIERRGLVARKGSPDTFDADAFAETLDTLHEGRTLRVPDYDRRLHDVVPNAATIPAATRLIVVEGNYLLLDADPWRRVRQRLDEAWYLDVPLLRCMQRVRQRHIAGGRTEAEADRKIAFNDRPNGELVAAARGNADRIVTL